MRRVQWLLCAVVLSMVATAPFSVTAKYFFQSWQGSNTYINSEELSGLAIGISLYTNRK